MSYGEQRDDYRGPAPDDDPAPDPRDPGYDLWLERQDADAERSDREHHLRGTGIDASTMEPRRGRPDRH